MSLNYVFQIGEVMVVFFVYWLYYIQNVLLVLEGVLLEEYCQGIVDGRVLKRGCR